MSKSKRLRFVVFLRSLAEYSSCHHDSVAAVDATSIGLRLVGLCASVRPAARDASGIWPAGVANW